MVLTISGVARVVSGPSGPSPSTTCVPRRRSRAPRKRVSARRGMLVSRSGSSVSRLATINLIAEFLAPLMAISPQSERPPVIAMLSILPLDQPSALGSALISAAACPRKIKAPPKRLIGRLHCRFSPPEVGAQSGGEPLFLLVRRLRAARRCGFILQRRRLFHPRGVSLAEGAVKPQISLGEGAPLR